MKPDYIIIVIFAVAAALVADYQWNEPDTAPAPPSDDVTLMAPVYDVTPVPPESTESTVASDDDARCAGDCSENKAGYQWAAENDITDEDDCGEDSVSFNEGCRAYVAENSEDDDKAAMQPAIVGMSSIISGQIASSAK